MEKKSPKLLLKRVKMLYSITCILGIAGIIFLFGTAGALECDTIGIGQATIQGIVSGAAIWLFVKYAEYLTNYIKIIQNRIDLDNEKIRVEKARVARSETHFI